VVDACVISTITRRFGTFLSFKELPAGGLNFRQLPRLFPFSLAEDGCAPCDQRFGRRAGCCNYFNVASRHGEQEVSWIAPWNSWLQDRKITRGCQAKRPVDRPNGTFYDGAYLLMPVEKAGSFEVQGPCDNSNRVTLSFDLAG